MLQGTQYSRIFLLVGTNIIKEFLVHDNSLQIVIISPLHFEVFMITVLKYLWWLVHVVYLLYYTILKIESHMEIYHFQKILYKNFTFIFRIGRLRKIMIVIHFCNCFKDFFTLWTKDNAGLIKFIIRLSRRWCIETKNWCNLYKEIWRNIINILFLYFFYWFY